MKEKTIGQSGPRDSPSPARWEQHLPVCQEGLRNWERREEAEGPGWGPRDSRAEMRFMTEASGPAEPAWWRPVSKSPERPDNGQMSKSARVGMVAGVRDGEVAAYASVCSKKVICLPPPFCLQGSLVSTRMKHGSLVMRHSTLTLSPPLPVTTELWNGAQLPHGHCVLSVLSSTPTWHPSLSEPGRMVSLLV